MSPVVFTVDFPEAEQVSRDVLRTAMPAMVQVVKARALELVPRWTGKLAKRIRGRVEQGGERGVVAAQARHAHLVHEGTSAHVITARRSRFLKVPSRGVMLFRRSVWHPGTAPQRFLTDALEQSRSELSSLLSARGEDYLGEALG